MKKILYSVVGLILMSSLASCGKEKAKLRIVMPQGAPAFAQAKIHNEFNLGNEDSIESIDTVEADVIKAAFTNDDYNMIYAPANIGASIYNANQSYVMLAGITFGNLYFASTTNLDTLSSFENKDIYLFGQNTINDLVSKTVLGDTNYNVQYLSSASDTNKAFISSAVKNEDKIYLLAEPTLSQAKVSLEEKGITIYTSSVQDMWEEKTGYDGFVQAALFVKKDFYNQNSKLVQSYLNQLEDSINYLNTNKEEAGQLIFDLKYLTLSANVISNSIDGCNIRFVKSSLLKESFTATYQLNLNLIGGSVPSDEFFAY